MKRKILLSLFVLMLSCVITLGVVGCDETSNPSVLTCDKTAIEISIEDWNKLYGENVHREPGLEEIQALKEAAFGDAIITYQKRKNVNGTQEDDGTPKTWTYKQFCEAGGQVSGFNLKNKSGTITLTYDGKSVEVSYEVKEGVTTGPASNGEQQEEDKKDAEGSK